MKTHDIKLRKVQDEATNVKSFYFSKPISFIPGQFVSLHIPSLKIWRSYSLASSPTEDQLMIGVLKEGVFTKKLFTLENNAELLMRGPFGRFTFNEAVKEDVVLLTGGIGVTPFRSMIKYAYDKKLPNKIWLFYSARNVKDFVFKKELEVLADCYFTVTQEKWEGFQGRITWDAIKNKIKDVTGKKFYICGSNTFAEGMKQMLLDNGVAVKNISQEKWGVST
jgi:glycine betaine catabolism B